MVRPARAARQVRLRTAVARVLAPTPLRLANAPDMAPLIGRPIRIGGMKITVEISDPLLRKARDLAVKEGVTLCTVIERGLNRVVAEGQERKPFRLRKASFKGTGLQPHAEDAAGSTGCR
jgi:hypothetical protein